MLPGNDCGWPVQACRLVQVIPGSTRDQTPKTRLVQTYHQARRPYVTLSHCWGPLERRPIRTLKENLQRHLNDIPWQDLPKTFQEACTICAELRIQYIWIDSLCIVQDDAAEWEAESAVMGRIYEESLFTIAASSAVDSSEGLFDVREKIDFVKIPYEGPEGLDDSGVYAFLESPGFHIDQDTTPLTTRAWVMQEDVLSRRAVRFTQYGLIWSCSEFFQRERDNTPTARHDVGDWHQLIARYSGKDLTYKSDKLHAIRGLANEHAKRNSKTYYYGVFIEDLPASFRWFRDRQGEYVRPTLLTRDVGNHIPSWSWASVTGKIEFLTLHDCQEEQFLSRNLRTLGSGMLGVEAPVKEIDGIQGPFRQSIHPGFYIEELRVADFEQDVDAETRGRDWEPLLYKRYILQDALGARIGWCCFDEEEAPMSRIFFLAIHQHKVREWWMPQKETADEKCCWGLVVSRRESSSAFDRVGYGHILDTAWIVNQPREDVVLM